jgi:4-hydroxy-tetrahydrodipicolinate synthase
MNQPVSAPPGILCALMTPFRDDQSPDPARLGEVIEFLAGAGVHGLFVLGTTGEGPMLDASERRDLAELVVRRVDGRVPVVVHCGAPDTKTTSELARHAERIGADGVAAVIPYYFRYGGAELDRHFRAVAEAAPSIPHYVYENPDRVGYSAGVGVVARLVNEVPNIVGVKDTGDTIGKITDYLSQPGRPIEVYVGNNSTILPALILGARGAVSAMANAVPELVVAVYERWREGRADEARALQFTLARLTGALAGVPFVGAVKHLMARRGLSPGMCRAPQSLLDAEEAALVDRRLAGLEELVSWMEPAVVSGRMPATPAATGPP